MVFGAQGIGFEHDVSQSIHGEVMVHTVKQKMKHHGPVGVRKVVVAVEKKSVEGVL